MNRNTYYNVIEEKLHTLAYRIITGGKLNMLSLHLHSEGFYQHFFNLLYGYNLTNLNQESQNVEAIDLIDHDNKIMIQVSSTSTKQKIESALSKEKLKEYQEYRFKFISIAKDATNLRDKTYKNPYSIKFDTLEDIYDIRSFLNTILSLDIDKFKAVHEFILKELGEESMNGDINNQKTVHAKTNVENINNHGVINIYNSEGKKLITKEEIEAQRAKEEKLIFSSTPKSNQPYINRDVDALLSNRIAQKKGCVIFLHGQGGIGKSTLLEKFSRSDRPSIFIHINEKVNMSMVDILLNRSKTSFYNCPKFKAKVDEISLEKKNNKETPFNAEFELLESIREDFGEHGVFIVDTLEKNKDSHITSQLIFDSHHVETTIQNSFYRFRDYLEELIYLFVTHTTFIIAGRNSKDELNMQLPLWDVEELALENFTITHIKELFSLSVKQDSKLSMPTQKHLIPIAKLTNGNPLLVALFPKIAREYNNGWDDLDYQEMERRIKTDKNNGLLFYMTDRVLSHLDDSKEVWKLVIPRVLTEDIERLLFKNSEMLEKLIDVGLARKGQGKEFALYYLHDDVHRAIVAYYEREFKNGFSSWHDSKEVAKLHEELMEFYGKCDELYGVNREFEGCYHKIMLKEGFEREFEVSRDEMSYLILGSLTLNLDDKMTLCQDWNRVQTFKIKNYIKQFQNDKYNSGMSNELYNEFSKAIAKGVVKGGMEFYSLLMDLLRKTSQPIDDWILFSILGTTNQLLNNHDKAIVNYKKAIKINPKLSANLYFDIGTIYNNEKKYDKAMEVYQKIIDINPKDDNDYNNRGVAYGNKKEYNKAIEAYQKAVEINPENDGVYNNMGTAYDSKGEYDNAIESYQKAIEINPQRDEAYNNMGGAYFNKKEYSKAIEAYQKSIALNPQRDEAYYNMGGAYFNKKEYNKAIEAYQKAVEINPKYDGAYNNMGIAYGKIKEYEKMIEALQKVFELNPKRLNWIMRFILRWM